MASFELKSFQQILADMIVKFLSETGVNDINPGSVLTTFLEAAAQEDAQQYFQMYQVIRNYVLDTTEGEDLDNRAAEYGLTRLGAEKSTGTVTISDSAVTQVRTKIYVGSRGPVAGQTYVDADNASDFDASGTIIIGRTTNNVESVAYSSITTFSNFYRFNLSSALTNDHGTDESIIMSQGGDRLIPAGTVVYVPASDISDQISFLTVSDETILDGDSEVTGVNIIAAVAGTDSNVPAGTIVEFDTLPFATAEVTNPSALTNARDRETDSELRDRIKDYIQSLSRGTKQAIASGVIGISSTEDNRRVTSANVVEAVTLDEISYLYIDDGTGLEPSDEGVGDEVLVESATGGETFLQLDHFPVIKAQVVSQNSAPFGIVDGDTLIFTDGTTSETITFGSADFEVEGEVTAYEITRAINDRSSIVEARTQGDGAQVVLRPILSENESIQVTGGTANASNKLSFPTQETFTIDLYKFSNGVLTLLSKDGSTASVESGNNEPFNLSGGETLTVVVDGKTANVQTITFQAGDFASLGAATAEEVVERINAELAGATASATSSGGKVTITSNTQNSVDSKIRVTGGTGNTALAFSTTQVEGADRDFTLNRFNGQIELVDAAVAGDKYEVGSTLTRGFLISSNAEPYNLSDFDTMSISVDGGADQTVTFVIADFININAATAQEVADVINRDTVGLTASVTDDDKVMLTTNTWSDSIGSIEVTAVTGDATALGFTVGEEAVSIDYHVATITASDAGPYAFDVGDQLVVVVDQNPSDNTFVITMDLDGVITTGDAGAPFTTFIANIDSISQNFNLKFTEDDQLNGFTVKWLTGTNAGTTSTVSDYNATTGQFTLTATTGASIDVGDTFTILPTTAANVVTYLNNTITSSLSSKATIQLADNGTKVQITSNTVGTNGAVQVTGNAANDELAFSTTQVEGRDGYKYYTGLLQEVQWTVDGLDSDYETYPGLKAAGVQIEVLPPIVRTLSLQVNLILTEEAEQSVVEDKAADAIADYINSLGVGEDVVLSEISALLMNIDGIEDVEFLDPTENIPISDNEIARIATNDIAFG